VGSVPRSGFGLKSILRSKAEVAKRGRPELVASFLTLGGGGDVYPEIMLQLKNTSGVAAVGIHIDDIRHGPKVMRFFPPPSIPPGSGNSIQCQILESGWGAKNNL